MKAIPQLYLPRLPDGSSWPDPDVAGDVQWTLRYGTPDAGDLLMAAAILAAYQDMVTRPCMGRKLPAIRRALRAVRATKAGAL